MESGLLGLQFRDPANLTLRTFVVINGGAAIAILTFLSGVAAKEKIDLRRSGWLPVP
jgi:hypothetical protein